METQMTPELENLKRLVHQWVHEALEAHPSSKRRATSNRVVQGLHNELRKLFASCASPMTTAAIVKALWHRRYGLDRTTFTTRVKLALYRLTEQGELHWQQPYGRERLYSLAPVPPDARYVSVGERTAEKVMSLMSKAQHPLMRGELLIQLQPLHPGLPHGSLSQRLTTGLQLLVQSGRIRCIQKGRHGNRYALPTTPRT